MSTVFVLDASVPYGDVDRDERLLLSGVFKLLQEAAIRHANVHDTGTRAMTSRGEAWVLNRVAVTIDDYPRHEDNLRVETWSMGVTGFRGYRDYRVKAGERTSITASSLWLYVNVRDRALARVPAEIVERFPKGEGMPFVPDLEKMKLEPPPPELAQTTTITTRYSDVDGMRHINNTAYLDYLQTALHRSGRTTRPRELRIRFTKEIPHDAAAVEVLTTPAGAFSIRHAGTNCAQGTVTPSG